MNYTIKEIEEIRLEDIKNNFISYDILKFPNSEDCNWEICNCRIPEIGHKFICNAYKYNLQEAIDLAIVFFDEDKKEKEIHKMKNH